MPLSAILLVRDGDPAWYASGERKIEAYGIPVLRAGRKVGGQGRRQLGSGQMNISDDNGSRHIDAVVRVGPSYILRSTWWILSRSPS